MFITLSGRTTGRGLVRINRIFLVVLNMNLNLGIEEVMVKTGHSNKDNGDNK